MNPVTDAFVTSWPFDPGLLIAFGITAAVYGRGWLVLRRRDPRRWSLKQPAAFAAGLGAVFLALASPIEPFADLFLQVHMVQHLLLMMAAPPLVWLGDPLFPLLVGLPAPIRTYWMAPLFRSTVLRRLAKGLTHPSCAFVLYVSATWIWHVPTFYETAVRSKDWHYLQHATFLITALIFWFPVVRPYPSRPSWSRWLLFPYLILADVQNTVLSALLAFSDRVLYPYYSQVPRLDGLSALDDQATAGVIMWVPGSLAFLLPLFWIAIRALFGIESHTLPASPRKAGERQEEDAAPSPRLCGERAGVSGEASRERETSDSFPMPYPSPRPSPRKAGERENEGAVHLLSPRLCVEKHAGKISLPLVQSARKSASHWDLLRLPLLGRFLRWKHARLCLQMPFLLAAAALIYDGLTGPAEAPMNLAGVLPWIHWRGLLIIGLLGVGNVFCMACPFMALRTFARRFFGQRFNWPHWLRNKWLAILMLALFFWAYDALALWDNPRMTAWIAIAYFAGALAIDSLFHGATFCKYLCPVGQFNFVQSLVSPWEIKARDPQICASCQTKDCIRGHPATGAAPAANGCELNLFVPRKSSSMDCTFCLDCVHACPHGNIGILSNPPAAELWRDPHRSGIGRFSKRPDLAVLVLLLVFSAFANAAGMVGPIAEWQDRLRVRWGLQTPFWPITFYYTVAIVALPLTAVGIASALSRTLSGTSASWIETAVRFVYALAPLGFAMWLSHYSFHLITSYDAAVPVLQRFAHDLGASVGPPDWICFCCRPAPNWLPRLEIVILGVGLLLSLYGGYRIALDSAKSCVGLRGLAPWAILMMLLYAAGAWIVLQPMQMRGLMAG